ncbi:MAG: type II toxin-antitoxin system RelE/ParE family toxin [Elusimicrobia bacterium]|nr:type II toxin-antitoxin system RelE/ParE family toxin [Elusimicrobiota bacterium]
MYKIKIISQAQKDLNKLKGKIFEQIKRKIFALGAAPRPSGCEKLTGKGGYRIRVRDFRILYRIDDRMKIIFIYRIKHRKEVYR